MRKLASNHDERLAKVALDFGFLDIAQIKDCLRIISEKRQTGMVTNFSSVVQELGFLNYKQVVYITKEERRRRRLVTGYEILEKIGSGTVATVYRAIQLAMDREVALKVLHPHLAKDRVFVRAYLDESRAVSRFHHPHILQGFDVGEANGFYYFSHEYIPGGSLWRSFLKDGPLSEEKALLYLKQATSALHHAADAGVYHGDINPGNFFLNSQKNLKLANLGVPITAQPSFSLGQNQPCYGFVRYGPYYIAPEQITSPGLVTPQTDLYSLGATFFHLITGNVPFSGDTPKDIMEARLKEPIPDLNRYNLNFSQDFLQVIINLMHPDPSKRIPDSKHLENILNKFTIRGLEEWSGLASQVMQVSGVPSSISSPKKINNSLKSRYKLAAKPRKNPISVTLQSLKKSNSKEKLRRLFS